MRNLLVKSLFRSASKYSSLKSKNLAELDKGILPGGIHRQLQCRQTNTNGDLFENVIILK